MVSVSFAVSTVIGVTKPDSKNMVKSRETMKIASFDDKVKGYSHGMPKIRQPTATRGAPYLSESHPVSGPAAHILTLNSSSVRKITHI